MNSRMRQFGEMGVGKQKYPHRDVPDRIKGTSKIRTYVSNESLYSKESSMDKLMQRAGLCSNHSEEQ